MNDIITHASLRVYCTVYSGFLVFDLSNIFDLFNPTREQYGLSISDPKQGRQFASLGILLKSLKC